jgi:nitrite reductase/ring-hydroxylating ferredoxin subunit
MNAAFDVVGCSRTVDQREFMLRATLIAGGVFASMVSAGTARADGGLQVGTISARPVADGLPLRRYGVPGTVGAFVDAAHELLLVRWSRRVYAFALTCPHRGATLNWQQTSGGVYCPKHKARFLANGTHTSGRATRDLDRIGIQREGDSVAVDLATRLRPDQVATAWSAAQMALRRWRRWRTGRLHK